MSSATNTAIALARKLLERPSFQHEPRAEGQLNEAIESVLSLIERRARSNPEIAALAAQVRAALRQ